ncbi:MAG: L-threonylcarbamoyladenylate synthase [Candidatus Saccharimonadales bacterium]
MKVVSSLLDPSIVSILHDGGIAVIPTDTVYGLVARAHDETAIKKMYSLKVREHQPGTIIGYDVVHLHDLGFSRELLDETSSYWPAPLSAVLPANDIAPYLKADRSDLPVRVPDYDDLLKLLKQTGPLMTTSANLPSEPTATTIEEAFAYFGDAIDVYVDGGEVKGHQPSTIIRINNGTITVLRHGAFDLPV